MSPEVLEFRMIISKWEHGEMTIDELYEIIKNKFSQKQLVLF